LATIRDLQNGFSRITGKQNGLDSTINLIIPGERLEASLAKAWFQKGTLKQKKGRKDRALTRCHSLRKGKGAKGAEY